MEMEQSYSVYDIFTPTSVADRNYIERKSINTRIVSALKTKGKQIIIYGHSGVGKSSLLKNTLQRVYEREIVTNCMKTMTFEGIILDAFDSLNEYYKSKITETDNKSRKMSISGSYLALKSYALASCLEDFNDLYTNFYVKLHELILNKKIDSNFMAKVKVTYDNVIKNKTDYSRYISLILNRELYDLARVNKEGATLYE